MKNNEKFKIKNLGTVSLPDEIHADVVRRIEEAEQELASPPKFGSAKGSITMSADFDEPLEDFKDFM